MARRDAFSKLRDPAPPNPQDGEIPSGKGDGSPRQPLDLIPSAEPRKKRSRNWERIHQCETVTYRGVPLEYHRLLGEIAQSLSVPRDEVVRSFLEYGVALYRRGQLSLFAYPKAQRMTLFPEDGKSPPNVSSTNRENREWLSQAFPTPSRKGSVNGKDKRGKASRSRWETRVTYRLPVSLKAEIKAIAEEHTLPIGEVVWFFIELAIKAYHAGNLPLQPTPKLDGKTLFQD
jgi:hypothetical protein